MDFSDAIKSVLKSAAPALASAVLGPLGGIAGAFISSKLGVDEANLAEALEMPENRVRLKEIESEWKRAQLLHAEVIGNQAIEQYKAEVDDRKDARKTHGQNSSVFWLGVLIIVVFMCIMGGTLWIAYQVLVAGEIEIDPGTAAAVFGLIGAIVGYVAAQAQQTTGYFFGSSSGSSQKTDAMADAIKSLKRP